LSFIPGNTIRGMLARRYLDLGGTPYDKTFHRLFTSGAVRFGFAHVAGAQPIPSQPGAVNTMVASRMMAARHGRSSPGRL
jgi:hypothetical protein